MCISMELVTAVLGDHGQRPNEDFGTECFSPFSFCDLNFVAGPCWLNKNIRSPLLVPCEFMLFLL